MSDGELLCNFKKCRKILTGTAYITRCSHAFCEDDGIKQIENQNFEKICPACQSPLVKSYDLVKVTLNPNDQFKSMVLAGLRPEVVMDVATRAITFWSYQQHQEQLHQSVISKSLKDFIVQIKSDKLVETGILKSEIQSLKRKQEELEKEVEKQTQRCNELLEKNAQKTREIQKWQMMFESLRRKQLSAALLQRENNTYHNPNPMGVNMCLQTVDLLNDRSKSFPANQQGPGVRNYAEKDPPMGMKSPARRKSDGNDGFVFQPRSMNPCDSPKVFFENTNNCNFHPPKNL